MINLLKSCGGYMKTVSFPDYVPPLLELVNILDWCCNVVELSLPNAKLDTEQLRKAKKTHETTTETGNSVGQAINTTTFNWYKP